MSRNRRMIITRRRETIMKIAEKYMSAKTLERAIKETKEFLELNRDHDEDEGPTDDDAFDSLMDDCGMMDDGGCSMVGSEYCDWDCPFSDEL